MALQLADRGFNIVMLSHSQVKMDEIAKEIEAKGMMAKAYSVDFASCSGEQWEEIDKIVQERKVSILINNVELNHRYPIYFDEEEHSACDDMVEVNINTMMNLTRIAVPQMRERKNGLILNMGSYASARSMPFMSVYAGTKGFVKTYSQSLAYELEADGIVVNQVFNFWVASEVSGYRAPSQLVPSPQQYVQCLLERTGLRCGSTDSYTSIPYHTHSFLNLLISYFWDPRLAQPVFYNFAHNLYRLGQKKQAKEKAWRETLDRAVKEEIARLKALEIEQTGLQSKDVSANA
ncbi:hypothetical protein GGI12_003421 [Dipsacomyces acuminosporus]|nr:hypothetical protein GGI12_003421 [Dipsacomyces acuminosporus]